jgi:hypothetical protein
MGRWEQGGAARGSIAAGQIRDIEMARNHTALTRTRATDGTFTGPAGLTEKQAAFVKAFVELGGTATKAAEVAGYADPRTSSWGLLRLPHIQAAIRAERERTIMTEGASIAWATMKDLMQNPKYTGAVKFQAAKWTLEAAGSGLAAHRAALGLPDGDKPLSEMTLAELDAFLAAGKQALETLREQRERVIEGVIVPNARDNARNSECEDVQLIDSTGGDGDQSSPQQGED